MRSEFAAGGVNRFLTARSSVVLVSTQSQAPGYKEALRDLCKIYWYSPYAFIRTPEVPGDIQPSSRASWLFLRASVMALSVNVFAL